jgi:hypothetical protein
MRKAWVEDNVIRDIAPEGNPVEFYHPDIARLYSIDVPAEARIGDSFIDGQIVAPPEPTPLIPPKVSPVQFKLLFTSAERIAIKNARKDDAILDDFFDIVEDPRLHEVDLALQSTQDGLRYLAVKGLLPDERVAEIIKGQIK